MMKRLILSATLVLLGAAAFAPAVLAQQESTPSDVSPNSNIQSLVQVNRDLRHKK